MVTLKIGQLAAIVSDANGRQYLMICSLRSRLMGWSLLGSMSSVIGPRKVTS